MRSAISLAAAGYNSDPMTQSWWWNFAGNPNRGNIDINFAFAGAEVKASAARMASGQASFASLVMVVPLEG